MADFETFVQSLEVDKKKDFCLNIFANGSFQTIRIGNRKLRKYGFGMSGQSAGDSIKNNALAPHSSGTNTNEIR